MSHWSAVKIAIVCGGSDGRAAVERRVREKGFAVSSWAEFLHDLAQPQRTLFDYETRCDISVVDAGAWKYAYHESNEILCVGWSSRPFDERIYCAHNSGFEDAISERHVAGWRGVPFRWSCTASRARRLGLPGGLEGACNVMRTPHRKSVEGHRIMLQVSQPRPAWVHNGTGSKWYDDADRLAANAVYCGEDILAERDLDDALPELSPHERAIWEQVERGNRRGLCLDVELIGAMERMVDGDEVRVLKALRRPLHEGGTGDPEFSLTAPASVRDFCAARDVVLADLKKETVEAVLAGHRSGIRPIDALAALVLEGRQSVGRSSNAKLPAMRDRLQDDGFARDYAIYHGAHTGRQTGSKINPLNYAKPYKGYDQETIIELIRRHAIAEFERLRATPSLAVSASLRGTLIAPPGKKFVIGDYKSIEPCAIFTLAGQWDAVEVLRRRESLYVSFSPSVYGRQISKDDKAAYDLCKAAVLGCGYGLGFDRFWLKLQADGVDVDESTARRGHAAYRTRFNRIKPLWDGLEQAVKSAIRNPHQRYAYGVISCIFDGYWLVITLPNGRPLFYPNARLQPGKYSDEIVYEGRLMGGGWGDVRTWGGAVLENLAQAISRDITMEDKLEIERLYGWHVPLDVYDEIVAECDEYEPDTLKKLYVVMERSRSWLPEMPVQAEGFIAKRYRKGD